MDVAGGRAGRELFRRRVGVLSATAGSSATAAAAPHGKHAQPAPLQNLTESDLRALLGRQLGEHAVLAMSTTNLGVTASPAFPAAAKAPARTRRSPTSSATPSSSARARRDALMFETGDLLADAIAKQKRPPK